MNNYMFYLGELCYVHVHMHVDDTDIAKIEQRAKKAEESVGQLKEEGAKLNNEVAELRRQLVARDQTIESLRSQLRTIEIRVGNAERSGREVPPKPTPRVCMYLHMYIHKYAFCVYVSSPFYIINCLAAQWRSREFC